MDEQRWSPDFRRLARHRDVAEEEVLFPFVPHACDRQRRQRWVMDLIVRKETEPVVESGVSSFGNDRSDLHRYGLTSSK